MQDGVVLDQSKQILERSGYHDLKMIRCSIEEFDQKKYLVLRGVVSSFFLKQQAQAVIRDFINGYEIKNMIFVTGYRNFS